ncbi:MAG: MBL fold metallo-hydrolase [Chloroflexi bacterium]|nr:MBL fold metallo-hydrolase [Chloroflexota bacterium]
MEVRVLGAHSLESRDTKHTCMLIDGVLGMDAGSLTSTLNTQEQAQIQAVLLTHRHFDHIQSLPTLGLATLDQPGQIDVYSLQSTLDAVHQHLLNGDVYPDFTKQLNSSPPKFRFHSIEGQVPLKVLNFEVKPIPVPHAVPAVGYIVRSDDGGCVAFTGDAGGELLPFFQDSMRPQVLFVDVTFRNSAVDLARLTGHLTPWLLREQLIGALDAGLSLPRVVAVHLHPDHREQVLGELSDLAAELGVDLVTARDGMVVTS